MISKEIFRAYDIRGIVGKTLQISDAYLIGQALATYLKKYSDPSIIIARDGRLSSPTLSKALKNGLLEHGIHVIDVGEIPTPLLYFATCHLTTKNGVIITASHNPAEYNGFKIVINGKPLPQEGIQLLYSLIVNQEFTQEKGHYSQVDIIPAYFQKIQADFQCPRPFKIVIDCANSIAGKIAPSLFRKLGFEVVELFCEPDGRFPNHLPDQSEPENLLTLIATVKETQAALGIAYDGDADRVFIIDETGRWIPADYLLMLFATEVLSLQPAAEIVFDIKCSYHLRKLIEKLGGKATLIRTGHTFLKKQIHDSKAALGGEASGHFVFNDRWYGFDDGFYATVRVLEIMQRSGKKLSELLAAFPLSALTPELKIAMAEESKTAFINHFKQLIQSQPIKIIDLDGLRVEFPYGWGLIRPSHTTPYLTLRFEADTEENLTQIKQFFRQHLLQIQPQLALPF